MKKLVECVPNFSEGRDQNKIGDIVKQMSDIPGITVLDVDPGPDTNRTVVTIVGLPEAVGEAAFQGIKRASEVLDMSQHFGTHPRMGATDVCPFIPVSDVSIEECVKLSKLVGKRVGDELGIPVYLYEKAIWIVVNLITIFLFYKNKNLTQIIGWSKRHKYITKAKKDVYLRNYIEMAYLD